MSFPRRDSVELESEIPSLRQRPSGCEFHTRCPYAQPRCRFDAPISRTVSCHFPLG